MIRHGDDFIRTHKSFSLNQLLILPGGECAIFYYDSSLCKHFLRSWVVVGLVLRIMLITGYKVKSIPGGRSEQKQNGRLEGISVVR